MRSNLVGQVVGVKVVSGGVAGLLQSVQRVDPGPRLRVLLGARLGLADLPRGVDICHSWPMLARVNHKHFRQTIFSMSAWLRRPRSLVMVILFDRPVALSLAETWPRPISSDASFLGAKATTIICR